MPAISTITINDGESTPVAHVFDPVTTNGSKSRWANRAAGLLNASEILEIEVVQGKSPTAAYRMIGSLTRPILGTVEGVEQIVRQEKMDFTLNFAPSSTAQDRKNDVALLKNLFSDASFSTAAQNAEPWY